MKRTLVALLFLCFTNMMYLNAQLYRMQDKLGKELSLNDLVPILADVDVVFFGETHDDSIAHLAQYDVYNLLLTSFKNVALSMEMFETDVQTVVDEYLGGKITEDFLIKDARAWKSYATDYKPVVELAKSKKMKVIAANAPRRYVRMVSKNGAESLLTLPESSKKYLPKLPFHIQYGPYEEKFGSLMGGIHDLKTSSIYHSQNLWDASMANSIAQFHKKNKNAMVLHLCGKFHCEERLGTVSQLARINPRINSFVIVAIAEKEFAALTTDQQSALADVVIITPGKNEASN